MADLPPWFGKEREKRNARSKRQEEERAKEIGGKRQAGSGSSWRAPEDVVGKEVLEQLKFTDQKGFRITVNEWKRLRANAYRLGREPRMVIDFERDGIRLIITEEQ